MSEGKKDERVDAREAWRTPCTNHRRTRSVGPGGVIDEPALVRALQEKRLARAALNVSATEPLPADSPLWELSNVLPSLHTAALFSLRENERLVELFAASLRCYLAGEELVGRVDTTLLY